MTPQPKKQTLHQMCKYRNACICVCTLNFENLFSFLITLVLNGACNLMGLQLMSPSTLIAQGKEVPFELKLIGLNFENFQMYAKHKED